MNAKIKFVRVVCLSLPLLFIGNISSAQSALTLSDCLNQVKAASASTRQITLVNESADLKQKIVSRNFWPQLTLGGKATWQSDVTSLPIEIPNFNVPAVPQDQYSATLDFSQIIYDGGATKAMHDISAAETELKVNQLESTTLNAEKQSIGLFFQIALQEQLKTNAGLLHKQLEASLEQAEKLFRGGVVDKRDVASIQIKLLEISQKIKEANYYISTAKKSLANLMQISDTTFTISFTQDQQVSTHSFDTRPELKALQARSHLLMAQNDLNDARVRPTLATFINTGYGRPGLNFLANTFDWYALGGIKLTVPIDHLYTRKKDMQNQINRVEMQSTGLAQDDLLQNLQRVEIGILDELRKLSEWVEEDQQILELRKNIQEISEAKWKSGVITTIEYLAEITEMGLAEERLATHQTLMAKNKALLMNLYAMN